MANKVEISIILDGLKKVTSGFSEINKKAGGIGKGLTSVGNKGVALGRTMSTHVTGPIVAAGGAMFAFTKKMTDAGNSIDKTAASAGIMPEELQKIRFALGQISQAGAPEVDKALQTLNKRLGDATNGNAMYQESLMALGFSLDEIESGTLSTSQVFQRMTEQMPEMASSSEAAAVAAQLMGANVGKELGPALRRAGGDVTALGEQLAATGGIMSNESVAASAKFTDQLDLLGKQFNGVGISIMEGLLPIVSDVLVPFIQDKLLPTFKFIVNVVGIVGTAFAEVFQGLPGPVQDAAKVIGLALGVGGPILLAVGGLLKGLGALVTFMGGPLIKALTLARTAFMAFFAVAGGPVTIAIAAVAALVTAWVVWGDDIKALIPKVLNFIKGAFDKFIKFISGAWEGMTEGLKTAIDATWDFIVSIFGGAIKTISDAIKTGFSFYVNRVEFFMGLMKTAISSVLDFITGAFDKAVATWRSAIDSIGEFFDNSLGKIVGISESISSGVTGAFDKMKNVLVGNSIIPDTVDAITEEWERLRARLNEETTGITTEVPAKFETMRRDIEATTGVIVTESTRDFEALNEKLAGEMEEMRKSTEKSFEDMTRNTGATTDAWTADMLGDGKLGGFVDSWLEKIDDLTGGTVSKFEKMGIDLGDVLRDIGPKLLGQLDQFTGGWLSKLVNLGTNTLGLFDHLMRGIENIVGNVTLKAPNVTIPVTVERKEQKSGGFFDFVKDVAKVAVGTFISGGLPFPAFARGGDFIASQATPIMVGDGPGAERVTVTPLSGRSGGSGGVTVVFQGPTVLDDISMSQFERRIAEAVRRRV